MTRYDKTRQAESRSELNKMGQVENLPALTSSQLRAVNALAEGLTDGEAAEEVGVSRQTVSRWKLHHPLFIAALNLKRRALWAGSLDGMRSLVPLAVERLRDELKGNGLQAVRVALDLVKTALPRMSEAGPTEAKEVIAQAAQEADERLMASLSTLMDDSKSHEHRQRVMLAEAGEWE